MANTTKKAPVKTTKKTTAKTVTKKTVAKKAPAKTVAKKTVAKKTAPAASEDRTDFVSSWRLKTKKTLFANKVDEKVTMDKEVFPSFCRAAGMQHEQVVKAVTIVRNFTHEAKGLAKEYIETNSDAIGNEKITVAFPVTGLDDGRGGVPKVIIEHKKKAVKVNTPDGEVHEDLNVTVSTVHLGPTAIGRLTK